VFLSDLSDVSPISPSLILKMKNKKEKKKGHEMSRIHHSTFLYLYVQKLLHHRIESTKQAVKERGSEFGLSKCSVKPKYKIRRGHGGNISSYHRTLAGGKLASSILFQVRLHR
jgi:hypothetical protein